MRKKIGFFILFICLLQWEVFSQSLSVRLGKAEIALNEYFTIEAVIQDVTRAAQPSFPDIKGFQKGSVSTSSQLTIINGRRSAQLSFTCHYQALREGKYTLSPFTLKAGDLSGSSTGTKIVVGPARQQQQRRNNGFFDPFDDPFFGGGGRTSQPQEFVEVKDDGVLKLSIDKTNVYKHEPVHLQLHFYIPERQVQQGLVSNLGDIHEYFSKHRSDDFLVEELTIDPSLAQENVSVNGVRLVKVKVFDAVYYPIRSGNLIIPAIEIEASGIVGQSKQRGFWGHNVQKGNKKYKSNSLSLDVKPLPPHPLKDVVPVGDYQISAKIANGSIKTGETKNLSISIFGEGRIELIDKLNLHEDETIHFFGSNSTVSTQKARGHVYGNKTFDFDVLVNEPGVHSLSEYLDLIYFNFEQGKYDTLRIDHLIEAIGESQNNVIISSSGTDEFYLDPAYTNEIKELDPFDWQKWIINGFLSLVLIFVVIAYRLNRKNQNG